MLNRENWRIKLAKNKRETNIAKQRKLGTKNAIKLKVKFEK